MNHLNLQSQTPTENGITVISTASICVAGNSGLLASTCYSPSVPTVLSVKHAVCNAATPANTVWMLRKSIIRGPRMAFL